MTRCTLCNSTDLDIFFKVDQVPVHSNVLCDTREDALAANRGDIHLAYCRNCGHIFNAVFDPKLMKYDQIYENSLHFSPRFQEYAEQLAGDLIDRYDLHHKDIIDVGCGRGDFLEVICMMGNNRGVGFDKSYLPKETHAILAQLRFVLDFYTEEYADTPADCLLCRHVLEHIQKPVDFMQGIRCSLGERVDTLVFFEVPNALYTLRDMGIWDIIYEHCSYFTAQSLTNLFMRCGFTVHDVAEVYSDQFLTIEATLDGGRFTLPPMVDIPALVQAFAKSYAEKIARWQCELAQMQADKARVVIWGSGSKGVTFLNALQTEESVAYAVDINPRKQGKFVAGTGQQIMSPDFLTEYQPDTVLIMNPVYQNEIQRTAWALGIHPRFMVV